MNVEDVGRIICRKDYGNKEEYGKNSWINKNNLCINIKKSTFFRENFCHKRPIN